MLRKLLISGAMALTMASLAGATTIVSYSTSLSSTATDIFNATLAMQKFDPTLLSVPVGFQAVLQSFTITYNETISTTNLTLANTGGASAIEAEVSSRGYVYLFNPTPAIWGPPLDLLNLPSDDAFGGLGPKPSYSKALNMAPSSTAGPFALSGSASGTTGSYADIASLTAVQSSWNAYVDTFTKLSITATGSGNGNATFNNFVNGSVTVNYSYDLINTAPEPASMTLFGSALVGMGLLVARRKRNKQ